MSKLRQQEKEIEQLRMDLEIEENKNHAFQGTIRDLDIQCRSKDGIIEMLTWQLARSEQESARNLRNYAGLKLDIATKKVNEIEREKAERQKEQENAAR